MFLVSLLFVAVQRLMYSGRFFRLRCMVRRVVEARKSGTPCFSCRSLLLSTIVLNDNSVNTKKTVYHN